MARQHFPAQKAADMRTSGMLSPFLILVVLALLFAVLSMVWPSYPLVPVAVILLCVAMLIHRA